MYPVYSVTYVPGLYTDTSIYMQTGVYSSAAFATPAALLRLGHTTRDCLNSDLSD